MITLAQAREKFIASVKCQQATEILPLNRALLRVAAKDVISTIAVPPTDNSAMDGFALNSGDIFTSELQDKVKLAVSQRVPAGSTPAALQAATAARIFTGGVVPAGADAVVIQENCEYDDKGEFVTVLKPVSIGENIRPQGQDIAIGAQIVDQGQRLNAVHLGLLASVGQPEVEVYKRLKVAVFSTGDELIEPGKTLGPGQIYNSNRTMLLALCEQLGFSPVDCGIVEDTLDATKLALSSAAESADIILSSGGVSVGEEDHIRPAIEALGELNHWKVQMKPGKPVVLGKVADTPILGLPGNPVSSYVVFQLLGLPLLRALQGDALPLPTAFAIKSAFAKRQVSREEYIRVRLGVTTQGKLQAELFENQSSGVLSSLSWADGLVRQHIDQQIEKGDTVDFLPLREGLL